MTDHGCKLRKIVESINEDTYAIGMNKGFPLKESISAVISKYNNNGYIDILKEKWYGGLPCYKQVAPVDLDMAQPRPLGVAAVAGKEFKKIPCRNLAQISPFQVYSFYLAWGCLWAC